MKFAQLQLIVNCPSIPFLLIFLYGTGISINAEASLASYLEMKDIPQDMEAGEYFQPRADEKVKENDLYRPFLQHYAEKYGNIGNGNKPQQQYYATYMNQPQQGEKKPQQGGQQYNRPQYLPISISPPQNFGGQQNENSHKHEVFDKDDVKVDLIDTHFDYSVDFDMMGSPPNEGSHGIVDEFMEMVE